MATSFLVVGVLAVDVAVAAAAAAAMFVAIVAITSVVSIVTIMADFMNWRDNRLLGYFTLDRLFD
jgi:hypothetical protein